MAGTGGEDDPSEMKTSLMNFSLKALESAGNGGTAWHDESDPEFIAYRYEIAVYGWTMFILNDPAPEASECIKVEREGRGNTMT